MKFQLNPIHWSVINYFTWLMNKKLYMMILFSSLEIEKFHSWVLLDNGIENHFCNHTTPGLLVGKGNIKI
jgi:hypothetical protein